MIGPGLGTAAATQAAVRDVLAGSTLPAVADGDALTALGTDAASVLAGRADTVLTPHDGEFERLAGAPPGPTASPPPAGWPPPAAPRCS